MFIKSRRIWWAYKSLVGKPEEKRSLGMSNHMWRESVKMAGKKMAFENVDWIHVAPQDRDQ
jgi:hypothetical protein